MPYMASSASPDDFVKAKQALTGRLLRAGLRGRVVGMVFARTVSAAAASAGRAVHAVGVGRKIVNGEATDERCVRIYVVQKLASSLLSPRDRLPKKIDGIATDVIESPPAFLAARARRSTARAKKRTAAPKKRSPRTPTCSANRRAQQRPVVAGISAAHEDVTAGTIACFCHSLRHGDDPKQVHVLSNNHVFADVNHAQAGDDLYQPGPADGATPSDHFADLHRFVEMHLGGTVPNRVDAAIGSLLPGIAHRGEVCQIGRITGTARAEEDLKVRKHGRTSGYTEGEVTDVWYDALVGMDHNDPSVVALFQDQIRIEAIPPYYYFGLGGDSGSLVVEKARASAVGLYFAGPPSGTYGLANHIQNVLSELEIELL